MSSAREGGWRRGWVNPGSDETHGRSEWSRSWQRDGPPRTRRWSKALKSTFDLRDDPWIRPGGAREAGRRRGPTSRRSRRGASDGSAARAGRRATSERSARHGPADRTPAGARRSAGRRTALRSRAGEARRAPHLVERPGARTATEPGEQPRRPRGRWRGSPGELFEGSEVNPRFGGHRRRRGAAARSVQVRPARGGFDDPEHAWFGARREGQPGAREADHAGDGAPPRGRRSSRRPARSVAAKRGCVGGFPQPSPEQRCRSQEAAKADRTRRVSVACAVISRPAAAGAPSGGARIQRSLSRRCRRSSPLGARDDLRVGAGVGRGERNGTRAEGVVRRSAVGEGKSSEGRRHDGNQPGVPAGVHPSSSADEGAHAGESTPRNVVNRESAIELQHARGLEGSKTAEGARNSEGGTASDGRTRRRREERSSRGRRPSSECGRTASHMSANLRAGEVYAR